MRPDRGFRLGSDKGRLERTETRHPVFLRDGALFADPNRRDFDVSRAVDNELRRKAIGRIEGQLFTVVYTARDGAVRIISARRSNVQEVRRYGDR
jgi:uncharacterized protein